MQQPPLQLEAPQPLSQQLLQQELQRLKQRRQRSRILQQKSRNGRR
ncbi:MAG TPA: hypothetical protein VHB99_03140 [Pirellulales bacterium]|nr:hypothetical protein [Pirellulales bacterium]